jgi:hypothetical protein
MGCQKAITQRAITEAITDEAITDEAITDEGADYVLALKDNQAAEDLNGLTDRLGANVEQFDLGEGAGGEKSHEGRGDSEGQGDPEAPPQAPSPQASSRASRDYGGDGRLSGKASL